MAAAAIRPSFALCNNVSISIDVRLSCNQRSRFALPSVDASLRTSSSCLAAEPVALTWLSLSRATPRFPFLQESISLKRAGKKRSLKVCVQMSGFNREGATDADNYLEAQVVDAVRMVPSCNRLYMSMLSGQQVEVVHVNPTAGRLLHQSSTPTIFLRILDSSNLMLPIVVGEAAVMSLMKALHMDVPGRPTQYELMGNLVELLNYEVRMVKVTDRVVDTYIARIYFGKPGFESSELLSVDARPSDAINLAVRSKVPIFVNRSIVLNDSVRPAHEPIFQNGGQSRSQKNPAMLDRALEEHDIMAEEMTLLKHMMAAVSEERYADAAHLRDELNKLRKKGSGHLFKQH